MFNRGIFHSRCDALVIANGSHGFPTSLVRVAKYAHVRVLIRGGIIRAGFAEIKRSRQDLPIQLPIMVDGLCSDTECYGIRLSGRILPSILIDLICQRSRLDSRWNVRKIHPIQTNLSQCPLAFEILIIGNMRENSYIILSAILSLSSAMLSLSSALTPHVQPNIDCLIVA